MLFENNDEVRVRFAPSPTGYLHIGGARTAIFNWLFARHHGGKFLLRIEDTDFLRSDKKMVDAIVSGLNWLGISWDEEIVFQSKRLNLYRKISQQLIDQGNAYYCFCSQQRLEKLRQTKAKNRDAYFYDGHCRNLSKEQQEKLLRQSVPKVVRFKVEAGETTFADEVRGSLKFDNQEIDDFVIMRSDDVPTYHLAVVVDDYSMGITHVIRGDDHLTNTPKQVLIYQSLQQRLPKFAHVPLILGPDKKRLSKRHGATSVIEYKESGFLSDALFNYLALLGWNPGDEREILSQKELVDSFSITNINKNSAVFDETKLAWMNGQYISRLNDKQLYDMILPELKAAKDFDGVDFDESYIKKAVSMLKPRLKKITDFIEYGKYFFVDPVGYDEKAVKKHWRGEDLVERLSASVKMLSEMSDFCESEIENKIRTLAESKEIGAGKLIHPIRLALTGFAVSPGLFELMEVLGKDVVIRRLNRAISFLKI